MEIGNLVQDARGMDRTDVGIGCSLLPPAGDGGRSAALGSPPSVQEPDETGLSLLERSRPTSNPDPSGLMMVSTFR